MNQSEIKTKTMHAYEITESQKAIDEFFEGYGDATFKEYGNTLFELVSILKEKEVLSREFEKEVFSKLNSLHRLISNLEPTLIELEQSRN